MIKKIPGLLCLLLTVSMARAQVVYKITKTSEPIKIDGNLAEKAWEQAERYGNFWQQFPYDTSTALTKTYFKLLYDDENIYAAFYCYERNTAKSNVVQSLKRDFSVTNNDAVILSLSPFSDGQNGFSFGVNPFNAQREGALENGGNFGVTTAWDQVWFSATHRDSSLWTAEFKIPLKSIRFSRDKKNWQFNVQRVDMKNNEKSCFIRVPRNLNISSLNSYAVIQFPDDNKFKKSKNVTLIPYISTNVYGDKKNFLNKPKLLAGGDAKIAITNALNLDLTVNPDFAQVDVDVQQINLTRFSLFYPERRQFFLENNDLFANFGFSQIRPFFSRRIGISGSTQIPILAGARLSGKLNNDWRIGVMDMQTDAMPKIGVSPKNYFTAAVQRKVFGASTLGAILVNEMLANKENFGNKYCQVGGLEYNLNSVNSKWIGKAFVQKSNYSNVGSQSFAHATFLRYRDIHWRIDWNHEHVGKDFRAPTGFVPRLTNENPVTRQTLYNTFSRLEPGLARYFYPRKNKRVNNFLFELYHSSYSNQKLKPTESNAEFTFTTNFQNSALVYVSASNDYIDLFVPFAPIKPFKPDTFLFGKYHWNTLGAGFATNLRKLLSGGFDMSYGAYYTNGTRLYLNGNIQYRFQPFGYVQLSMRRDYINLPGYGKQNLDLLGFKTEITMTPLHYFTLFLQYNTQANNVNVNARFQWRYRPMSDFFLVYSENYLPDFVSKERSLSIKWVYWLNL